MTVLDLLSGAWDLVAEALAVLMALAVSAALGFTVGYLCIAFWNAFFRTFSPSSLCG